MISVLYFTGENCQACHETAPHAQAMCEDRGYKFTEMPVESYPHLARRYQVTSLPTAVMLDESGVQGWATGSTDVLAMIEGDEHA